jgi:hypothetical protein
MNLPKTVFVLVLGFVLNVQAGTIEINEFPKPIPCGAGNEFLSFSLFSDENLEAQVLQQKFEFPFQGKYELIYAPRSKMDGVRLDICWDPQHETATLHRIIKRIPSAGFAFSFIQHRMTPESLKPSEALKNILFNQEENSELHLEFENSDEAYYSYLLKSHGFINGKPLLTLSTYDPANKNVLKVVAESDEYVGRVRVGQLFLEDPWATPKSIPAHRLVEINKDHENIRIMLEFSYVGRPGEYVSYNLIRAEVIDKNISTDNIETRFICSAETDKNCWNYVGTHHGLSDTFNLKFKDVTYDLGVGRIKIERTFQNKKLSKEIKLDDCAQVYQCGKDKSGKDN